MTVNKIQILLQGYTIRAIHPKNLFYSYAVWKWTDERLHRVLHTATDLRIGPVWQALGGL